ncbi:TPA: ATP-dependent endonuclease [Vibrio parahaemolyticus]
MYLKSFKIENYRKFGSENNVVEFVTPYSAKETQSVSNSTTLIVGKNNVGKTTITTALKHVVNDEGITGNKFNYNYLRKLLISYNEASIIDGTIESPYIGFTLSIGLDADPNLFSINNISDFIDVDDFENEESDKTIKIRVTYEVKEDADYRERVSSFICTCDEKQLSPEIKFREFIKLISSEVKFVKKLYDIEGSEISDSKFRVSDLIDIKVINASLDDGSRTLSDVFNKIIKYKLGLEENRTERNKIEDNIFTVNTDITNMVGAQHNIAVNDIVGSITDKKNMEVSLRSNLDFSSMFNKIIDYEFKEKGNFIPEDQFGLGYKNLMKIIGQLIEYIEKYESDKTHNKVNVICVEEPENYMHPQMQEVFIKNIDDAINMLLNKTNKKINSQLILTTHSSHILNSKIHTSNTFDNINYLTNSNTGDTKSIPLNDSNISGVDSKEAKKLNIEDLNFLKKHIKFKVSDVFFADAVILVEGITEEQLLNLVISNTPELNKHYICMFNINGAYAHIYKPLIDQLEIPCLVITDIDIKRSSKEKGEGDGSSFSQISSLTDRETTNEVIKTYICKTQLNSKENKPVKLPQVMDYFESIDGRFKLVYQKDAIEGYYASSFEEALILTNYNNDTLNKVLKEIKPNIYKEIVGKEDAEEEDYKKNIAFSYKWQKKLSSSKSDFANSLIYHMISESGQEIVMPTYITTGINWLKLKLNS